MQVVDEKQAIRAAKVAELHEQRRALIDRLDEELRFDLSRKLEKCGVEVPLVCTNCGSFSAALSHCDLKWCPACQWRLAAIRVSKYEALCSAAQWPLLVTFTVRNYKDASGLRHLVQSFYRLRKQRWFRSRVVGGIAAFEITKRKRTFHWHIHAFLDCKVFAVTLSPPPRTWPKAAQDARWKLICEEIAAQWEMASGRKASVHVRRVWKRDGRDIRPAITEVLKYSVKGSDLADREKISGAVGPIIDEVSKRRMSVPFGSFHAANKKWKQAERERRAGCKCADCGEIGATVPEFVAKSWTR